MNLTLYVLLASENELAARAASADFAARPSPNPVSQRKLAIYDPYRPAGKALQQASYRQWTTVQVRPTPAKALVLGASVFANALGFLALTAGMFLLLQIAQVSLG